MTIIGWVLTTGARCLNSLARAVTGHPVPPPVKQLATSLALQRQWIEQGKEVRKPYARLRRLGFAGLFLTAVIFVAATSYLREQRIADLEARLAQRDAELTAAREFAVEMQKQLEAERPTERSDTVSGSFGGSSASIGGSVQVKGYITKNGTYVEPHFRHLPGRR